MSSIYNMNFQTVYTAIHIMPLKCDMVLDMKAIVNVTFLVYNFKFVFEVFKILKPNARLESFTKLLDAYLFAYSE